VSEVDDIMERESRGRHVRRVGMRHCWRCFIALSTRNNSLVLVFSEPGIFNQVYSNLFNLRYILNQVYYSLAVAAAAVLLSAAATRSLLLSCTQSEGPIRIL
jgi:hypothetical protein